MNKFFFLFGFFVLSLGLRAGEGELDGKKGCTEKNGYTCCLESSKKSPFFISDEYLQGKKQYENFRDIDDDSISNKYIPRGTIIYTPPELYDLESSTDYRLPFKVLSVPNEKLENTAKKTRRTMFTEMFRGKKGKQRVKKDDIGYLDKRAVKSIDGYTFFVNEHAPAYRTPKGTLLNGHQLRPAMRDNDFMVTRCCQDIPEEGSGEKELCRDFHIFQVLNGNGKVIDNTSMYSLGCNFYQDLTAIPDTDTAAIGKVVELLKGNLETSQTYREVGVDSLEIILENNIRKNRKVVNKPEIKLVKMPMDDVTLHGPYNTRHYTPDDRGDTDAYIQPYAGCAFLQLAKAFQKECVGVGCEVQFGNLYHKRKCADKACQQKYSKYPDKVSRDVDLEQQWRKHKSHSGGECIDIRPFRKNKDDIKAGLEWTWTATYDRERTKKFMELAIKAGGTGMYFNDPKTISHFANRDTRKRVLPDAQKGAYWDDWWRIGAREQAGHSDHIHVCFKADNPRVQKTCRDGL
ncbi:MAG: hypothetical protein ACJAS4_003193 [Bacteriovoracaceae bacterium]